MGHEIKRKRGDTKPWAFKLWQDKKNNVPLDITGFTFRVTLNLKKDPVDDSTDPFIFQLVGDIYGDPANGVARVMPSALQMDLTPGAKMYFDFEVTDAGGFIDTPIDGMLKITQDKSK